MSKRLLIFLVLLSTLCLGAARPPFEFAEPGYQFAFPRDHGAHPAFRTEWWYFTGQLASGGREFGYELTFFRQGSGNPAVLENPSRWAPRQLYLAHFAVTDPQRKRFFYTDQMSREALGKAGARPDRLEVWIDSWRADQEGETIRLRAGDERSGKDGEGGKIDLSLSPSKPPVIHGEEGVSKKGEEPGQASHYYSFSRLETRGSLWVDGREEKVTGSSWMDHEFGSGILNRHQVGWDWFSIQLDDGNDYMLFQIRREKGARDRESSGTVIGPRGERRHLTAGEFTLTPIQYWKSGTTGANYPVGWKLEIPSERLSLESRPALPDQELITSNSTRISYWEGASRFQGTKGEKQVTGKGYIELTGYASPLKME